MRSHYFAAACREPGTGGLLTRRSRLRAACPLLPAGEPDEFRQLGPGHSLAVAGFATFPQSELL